MHVVVRFHDRIDVVAELSYQSPRPAFSTCIVQVVTVVSAQLGYM